MADTQRSGDLQEGALARKDKASEGGKTHDKGLWELKKERLRREFTHSARND